MSETAQAPPKAHWWSSWKTLQTIAFTVGWAAGVPAGALGALAWGVWSNQATYSSMEAKYVQAIASNTALATRVNALEEVNKTWASERSVLRVAFNDRLTKLETEVGPRVITSELLDRYGAHINALDGRSDEIKRTLDTMQGEITELCVEIRGIGAASGRKARACP